MTDERFLVCDENDWEGLSPEQRDWLVFKTLRSMDDRLMKLEKRPFIDKCYAFAGGTIGGFMAALGIKYLGK